MSIWKLFSNEEEAPVSPNQPKRKLSDAEYYATIERQKREAADAFFAGIEPKRAETAEKFIAFHKADSDAYSFSCERLGDFMALTMTRLGKAQPSVIDPDQRTVKPIAVTARVNLSLVTSIDLRPGKPPAYEDHLGLSISYRSKNGGNYSSSPLHVASEDAPMVASAWGWNETYHRSPWTPPPEKTDRDNERGMQWGMSYEGHTRTEQTFPRPAEDDRVYLTGLGASINCPFGRGEEVVSALMNAIAA